MMKQFFLRVVILLLLSSCNSGRTDWYPYFESQHKTPYGTEVFFEQLEVIFDYIDVYAIKSYTDDYLVANTIESGVFMYINPHFYPTNNTLSLLNNESEEKKELFISTHDQHNCFDKYSIVAASIEAKTYELQLKYFTDSDKAFTINNKGAHKINYFDSIPSYATVLGTVKIGAIEKPNYIVIDNIESNTRTFLHSNPELFTNYYMLNKNDGAYALNSMSYFTHTFSVFWDGYGTSRRYTTLNNNQRGGPSLLRYIFSSRALTFALFTLVALCLLFFAINHKRILRVAPILQPVKNSSLAYVKIISALFEDEKNKLDAAQYRTNYILDRIKEKYFLDTSLLDDEFLHNLSIKSEVREGRLKLFVAKLQRVKESTTMDKNQFLEFNKVLEDAINLLKLNQ